MKGLINTWKKKFPGKGNKCKCLKAEISLACFKNRKKVSFSEAVNKQGSGYEKLGLAGTRWCRVHKLWGVSKGQGGSDVNLFL